MSDEKAKSDTFLLIGDNQILYLDRDETTIGRSDECDVMISDPRVSRRHAKISHINERYLLIDLNSSGGSYINGRPVVQKLLESGDVITLAIDMKIVFGEDVSMIPENVEPYSPKVGIESGVVTSELDDMNSEKKDDE